LDVTQSHYILTLILQHLLEDLVYKIPKHMSAMVSNIRFLVISDTHSIWPYTLGCPAPPCDVLIHCGDLTQVGGLSAYKKAMRDIQTVDAELKLIIAGNHNLDLDDQWVRKNAEDGEEEGDAEDSRRCVEFMMSLEKEGVYYPEEGRHDFKLKDGRQFNVWASPYTPEFNGYAFAYGKDDDRFRNIPEDTAILITHGPPSLPDVVDYGLDASARGENCGCKMLGDAVKRVKPRLHCFGHMHEGRGVVDILWSDPEDGDQTVKTAPDNGSVLKIIKEEERKTSVLVNAAVWGGRNGWSIDFEI
jgi:Icc-related predicted phosphoesterase